MAASASPLEGPPASAQHAFQHRQSLLGHTSTVAAVKFSPDGTKLATSSADRVVNLWEVETGRHIIALLGHTGGISDIAFSSDSRFLASGSDDTTVRIWGVDRGKPVHEPLRAHTSAVLCLCFNPQGNLLASGGRDETIWLWDVRRGRTHLSLPAHSDPVSGVDFNSDGTMLVSCSWDGLIRMWDTSTGRCLKTIVHEQSVPISHISFTPNARYLLSTTLDSALRIWNYHTSKVVKTYEGSLAEKFGCPATTLVRRDLRRPPPQLSLDKGKGKEEVWILGGSEDGRVLAWDLQSRQVVLDLKAHDDAIISVACHPFLPLIASAAIGDHTVKLWEDPSLLPLAPAPHPLPPLPPAPSSSSAPSNQATPQPDVLPVPTVVVVSPPAAAPSLTLELDEAPRHVPASSHVSSPPPLHGPSPSPTAVDSPTPLAEAALMDVDQ